MRRLLLVVTLLHAYVAAGSSTGGGRVPLPPNNANIKLHGCLLKNLTSLPFCDASGALSRAANSGGPGGPTGPPDTPPRTPWTFSR